MLTQKKRRITPEQNSKPEEHVNAGHAIDIEMERYLATLFSQWSKINSDLKIKSTLDTR